MPRIQPVEIEHADAKTAAMLKAVNSKIGMVPNMMSTMAKAPVLLAGYLQLSETLGQGRLNARQREIIAIAVARENHCEYCLSAHATIGRGAGLSDADIDHARSGNATGTLEQAIARLALQIARTRAGVSDADVAKAHQAGLDDGLILEIVANVALNVMTNYVNRVADTQVDFPRVQLNSAA